MRIRSVRKIIYKSGLPAKRANEWSKCLGKSIWCDRFIFLAHIPLIRFSTSILYQPDAKPTIEYRVRGNPAHVQKSAICF
ncbi:hypothetical protein Y032_0012g1677 [Ancylostoma ceylanicum]|nr:hypothetical protein Y032_0012g1677 [Ancylostoma ceylanicum]